MSVIESSKWVSGPYAPLTEEITAVELEVEGTLPVELNGRYLRNGPNPVGPVDPATYHWFIGDGMVHGVRLREGRAEWYRNRWVRSTAVSEALGEDPVPGERHAGMDTANTNVIGLGGRTFALVEAGARPVELTYELDTIEHADLGGTLPNGYTAHPKVDPVTGDVHAIAYHWAVPNLQYIVIGPDARVRQVEPVEVDGGPMVHDCSITERWMVVYDLPVVFDLDVAMSGRFPYIWQEGRAARIGLLPLGGKGSDVRWFPIEPCYSYHPLNAFDDGDQVVIDLVRYPKMFDKARTGPDEGPPFLWRFTLDLATGTVTERQLSDVAMEFPRVDERRVGRPARWGYASEVRQEGQGNSFGGRLVRIDRETGDDVQIVGLGAGRFGGEWVMIPRSPDAAEDDGWLMSLVYDTATDRSDLLVLDAGTPDAGPVARVKLPTRVPLGFHGNWVAD